MDNLEWVTDAENNKHAWMMGVMKSPHMFGSDNPYSKKVIQLSMSGEKIKTWDSFADAVKAGFHRGHIWACCIGQEVHHKHFKWSYV